MSGNWIGFWALIIAIVLNILLWKLPGDEKW
jgi:hypothetical protein